MTQRCRVPAEDIITYSDGSLRDGRREIVEAHLAACPHCRARLAQYRDVDRLIQGGCGDTSMFVGQRTALRRRLANEEPGVPASTAHRTGKLITGFATVLLLVMFVYPQTTDADVPWADLARFAAVGIADSLTEDGPGPLRTPSDSSDERISVAFTPAPSTEWPFGSSGAEQAIIDAGAGRVDVPYVPGTDADGDGVYTSTEMQDAVAALFPQYEWPPGYRPDVETVISGFGEGELADRLFQAPGEYTVVGGYYRCAWGQTWLDAYDGGDAAVMDESMQHLRAELTVNPIRSPQAEEYHENMYDQAALGDPSLLRQHVKVNCGGGDWLDRSAKSP